MQVWVQQGLHCTPVSRSHRRASPAADVDLLQVDIGRRGAALLPERGSPVGPIP